MGIEKHNEIYEAKFIAKRGSEKFSVQKIIFGAG
jgi:hypothetical protein